MTSTKDDSIIGRYRSPTLHFFDEFKESEARPDFSNNTVKYNPCKQSYKLLKELENKFEQDLMSLTWGIEALGYAIAIAGQNEDAGYSERQLSNLGWLISHLGSEMSDLQYMQSETNHILKRSEVQP